MKCKQAVLNYLDKACRDVPITTKRIANSAGRGDQPALHQHSVRRIMRELVETGTWAQIKSYSTDSNWAYIRIQKELNL